MCISRQITRITCEFARRESKDDEGEDYCLLEYGAVRSYRSLVTFRASCLRIRCRRVFFSEDGGSTFLRNVKNSLPDCIVSHPIR
jgi:hypothetical protein